MTSILHNAAPFISKASHLFGCILTGVVLQWLIFRWIKIRNRKKETIIKVQLLRYLNTPSQIFLPLLIVYFGIPYLEVSDLWKEVLQILLVINLAWLLVNFLQAMEAVIINFFQVKDRHEIRERKILTQLKFLKNVAYAFIITLVIAVILWNIPGVRDMGKGLLTTAGLAGIIFGFAAQKSIANLIAGFQIATTQPIKIDDIVIVEGEWGKVEDITLTYVVIKTWDWRRLVLPLNYFNEKPFENWTMNSTDLIGSIYLFVDFNFPVQELREELQRILKAHPLWDQNIASLLVIDSSERSVKLRATFSAKNAADVWTLRCEVREKLIGYIQNNYPDSLPKIRSQSKQWEKYFYEK